MEPRLYPRDPSRFVDPFYPLSALTAQCLSVSVHLYVTSQQCRPIKTAERYDHAINDAWKSVW